LSLTAALDDVVHKAAAGFDGVSPTAELHGHDILHGKNDWASVEAIADHPVRVIIRGVCLTGCDSDTERVHRALLVLESVDAREPRHRRGSRLTGVAS
jgi:hypothetical protein